MFIRPSENYAHAEGRGLEGESLFVGEDKKGRDVM
jgi:hypothetical protein